MHVFALQDIPKQDLDIFYKVEKIMEGLPDIKLDEKDDEVANCHMLGRAFEKFFPVKCKDGYFYRRGWRHSWLVTDAGNIIDHYPWGLVGGPIIVVNDRFNPTHRLYHEYKLGGLDEDEKFRINTSQVVSAMEQTIHDLF